MTYTAPTKDLLFAATELADLDGISALPGFEDVSPDLFLAIIEEAGKFASEVLAPMNRIGDLQGAQIADGKVTTADGWKEAYAQFVEGGWNGLSFDPDRGGQGLPWVVSTAVQEIWYAANMAFGLCPLLTQGAVEALESHASDEQKDIFLNKLVVGEWTGTMNLTEPQAGSDLSAVKTRAVPNGDHYLITGQKIFITYGEHDLTENIIHLVLARLPDAPEGVKGISLFIVPKFLQDDGGNWTVRNDLEALSLEHKLGIHGSPTAVMGYGTKDGGAKGFLVGEENQGLMYMFTMMNAARHTVGIQGNALAERAYQQAAQFASDRTQGKAIDNPAGDRVAIIEHPDVKRLLLVQKSRIEALRSLYMVAASAMDKSKRLTDTDERRKFNAFLETMIPIVKGYTTEIGLENVSLALQVHGGMGFIEETGAAQHYCDQRITPIYEGTTGIQAMDIVGRKLMRDGGVMAATTIQMISEDIAAFSGDGRVQKMAETLNNTLDTLQGSIQHILQMAGQDVRLPAAVCEPYLRLWGVIVCGWQLAKATDVSIAKINAGDQDMFYRKKIETAKFYFATEMHKVGLYAGMIRESGEIIVNTGVEGFSA